MIAALIEQYDVPQEEQEQVAATLRAMNEGPRQIGQIFSELGFEVVEVELTDLPAGPDMLEALVPGFKLAIDEFLAGLGDQVAVSSLEEIVAFNNEDPANRAPYGQDNLERSLATDMSAAEFAALREANMGAARDGLNALFEKYGVDLLITDLSQVYAPAGFPAMSIPAGYDQVAEPGTPQDIRMIGPYLGEPALIAAGYAFEQATRARVEPDLEATMELIAAMEPQE
jgi:amidase